MLDAVVTSLVRVLITRRHLLEWMTAARSAQREAAAGSRGRTWRFMLSAVLSPRPLESSSSGSGPAACRGPSAASRLGSGARDCLSHRPAAAPRAQAPHEAQNIALRSLARRTWLFFEDFVGPDDHWLPPDHFQETPLGKVAPYTSPTNIGLLLLSTLAAYDLGYIGTITLVSRLRSTFESLERLERFRGHFLNWYDTRTLSPLLPRYVSTVDSGNLAACLRILGQACQRLQDARAALGALGGDGRHLCLLDDFVCDLETAKNIPAAGELRVLARELRDGVRAVKTIPRPGGRPWTTWPAKDGSAWKCC